MGEEEDYPGASEAEFRLLVLRRLAAIEELVREIRETMQAMVGTGRLGH